MTLLVLIIIAVSIYYFCIYKENYDTIFYRETEKKCPNCNNPVNADFNVCPVCKETLRKKCSGCGSMVDKHWKYCPYCEKKVRDDGPDGKGK